MHSAIAVHAQWHGFEAFGTIPALRFTLDTVACSTVPGNYMMQNYTAFCLFHVMFLIIGVYVITVTQGMMKFIHGLA